MYLLVVRKLVFVCQFGINSVFVVGLLFIQITWQTAVVFYEQIVVGK